MAEVGRGWSTQHPGFSVGLRRFCLGWCVLLYGKTETVSRLCVPRQVWPCTSVSELRNLSIVLAICAHVPLLVGWVSAFISMCRNIWVCPCLPMSAHTSGSRRPRNFMGVSVHMFLSVQCTSVDAHGFLNVSACKSRFMRLHL